MFYSQEENHAAPNLEDDTALQAPLLALPETLSHGEAAFVRTSDEVYIRLGLWRYPKAHGTVFVLQGRTEFIEKYYPVIEKLNSFGWSAALLDWRGQGLSQRLTETPQLSHVQSFHDYLLDLEALTDYCADWPKPWIILSHSMGGCISALALQRPHVFSGIIFSAPMFGLAYLFPLGLAGATFARMAAHWDPTLMVPGTSTPSNTVHRNNVLSSDPAEILRFRTLVTDFPQLALTGLSWGWLAAAFDAMDEVQFGPPISLPALVLYGDDDRVVSKRAIADQLLRMPRGRAIILSGSRHEPMCEIPEIKEKFWNHVEDFLSSLTPETLES